MTLSQLAEKYNIPKYIVYNRYKAKWEEFTGKKAVLIK